MKCLDNYNPAAAVLLLMSCAVLTMFCTEPVMLMISLAGAVALAAVRGGFGRGREALWYAAVLIISPAANALISHRGSTPLIFINDSPVTLEAIEYGAAMGVMLLAALLWFRSLSQIMTSDKILCIFGLISPKTALTLTMALRFAPLFARKAREIDSAQRAIGLYREDNIIDTVRGKLKVFSILTTWALENAITTADSMEARGYGSGRRTFFTLYGFKASDAVLMMLTAAFASAVIVLMSGGAARFSYYPVISGSELTAERAALYGVFAALMLMPAAVETEVRIRWHFLRSTI